MNKEELVANVALHADLNKTQANRAVEAVFQTISESLQRGEDVRMLGFGTFSVKTRKARIGRNPHTGDALQIKERKAVAFSAGKALKLSIK